MIKIGITERGDASLDSSWMIPIANAKVDGAILITKNITTEFTDIVVSFHNEGYKLIVHCTCTGYGGTALEPNVPAYKTQLDNLKKLIDKGFPKDHCVLRIDPIFPTEKGLHRVDDVIKYAYNIGLLPYIRVRVSILDEYGHVRVRFSKHGWSSVYGSNFQASDLQLQMVIDTLGQYQMIYETCAENRLFEYACAYRYPYLFEKTGCISNRDLDILGFPMIKTTTNPQQRAGCNCLDIKTELLNNKKRCNYKCEYCYWRD